ncbi:MAG: o-succinylbenzoate synthase [Candidatus Hydrogenedentes bacterium]|nr:o-succinylbenzoate synthase [Candidatus Hydrogenedentota bacterium]
MRIAKAEVFQYTLPLARPIPLRDGLLNERTGFLLKLYSTGGHTAWGDAAPLPGFSRESTEECRKTLFAAAADLLDKDDTLDSDFPRRLKAFSGKTAHSAAYFAVESAWHLLVDASENKSPWHRKDPSRDATLHLNALLAGTPDEIRGKAVSAAALGYRAVKLKVGRESMTEDIRLVREVRSIVGPEVSLRLDANQAWSLDDAVLFGKATADAGIAYIEEPCSAPVDLPAFRRETGIPYAIDESIHALHDMLHGRSSPPLAQRIVADVFEGAAALVWKPTLVHTPILGQLLFRDVTHGHSNRVVISAAFESGVGIAALANYAALFAAPDTPAGLDTYAWMVPDVLQQRLPLNGGTVDLHAINQAARTVDGERLKRIWPL